MFDNIFLRTDIGDPKDETPLRLYARIDAIEPNHIVYDAVSAQFFDGLPPVAGVAGWTEYSSKAPIFLLVVPGPVHSSLVELFESAQGSLPWLEVFISRGGDAQLYFNLFAEPLPVTMDDWQTVSPGLARRLNAAVDLSGSASASAQIQNAVDGVRGKIEWVGIYDVGQGNANGLCDRFGNPLAYFDLGGGVAANRSTFPLSMSDFCYGASPPVVLSHWDHDHWSSGARYKGAQGLLWLAPIQRLGATHATFAAGLLAAHRLLVWPPGLSSVTSGQMTIVKCTGAAKSRNHSGLAMTVRGPGGEPPILLAGDARYSAIPPARHGRFTSVVAPHHGADMKSRLVPTGTRQPGARVAYSFGQGNTYGHPAVVTEQDHHGSGWPHGSQGGSPAIERTTSNRASNGLGHIGLGWRHNPVLPRHACGSPTCTVSLQQT